MTPTDVHSSETAPGDEVVRKVYVRDLRDKQPVHTVFKITRKTRATARSGKVFLVVGLGDRTGEVDARVFDQVDTIEPTFQAGDLVLVRGHVTQFQGKPQVLLEQVDRLDPEPIDPAEFEVPPPPPPPAAPVAAPPGTPVQPRTPHEAPRPAPDGARAVAQIRELVERVTDPHVKTLLLSFLDDPVVAQRLPLAPAAKGIHHAHRGGLAEHILSVMRLGQRVADHYPMLDRDLVTAGALLHDIGKVQELAWEGGNTRYTDEGRLVGHIVMTAQAIRDKAAGIPGFPPLLEAHITHAVLAHHGQLEYGSPKVPMTLEAYVVHAIDSLDSRIDSWLDLMAHDPGETWTEQTKLYERHLWKGPAPTARGRSPVEGRGKRSEKRKRQRERGGAPAQTAPSPPGTPRLSFKPLEALTGEAPPSPAPDAPAAPSESEGTPVSDRPPDS
ncbi:MAG TPA: HD domain-containing protein [Myxococcaceae bacterium]|nr:HD domain-containing protein [Myxococcaceae bacterium]